MYKFINEHEIEQLTRRCFKHEGRTYVNPTPEQLAMAGYKDLVEGEMPEFDPKTEFITDKYVDGDVITHVYEVHAIEELTNDVISEE